MGRVLAIDYGTKRIGIAISDETKRIAFTRPFISAERKSEVLKFITDNQVGEIILGLPKNLSGEETAAAQNARAFGEWLEEETKLPVKYIDERFSTKEIIRDQHPDRDMVDSLVAQKMLENYLDNINK